MKYKVLFTTGLLLLSSMALPALSLAAERASCASLATMKLPDTTITSAGEVTGGSLAPRGERPITGLPPFCRVAAVTKPAVKFEVWLPLQDWNGKFQGVGNGANAGIDQLRRDGHGAEARLCDRQHGHRARRPRMPAMHPGRWAIRIWSSISAIAPST